MSSLTKSPTIPGVRQVIQALLRDETPPPDAALELVRTVLFPPLPDLPAVIDVCLVLGSRNCDYRVQQAFAACQPRPVRYIVSGGGPTDSGETEAAFMRSRLLARGVTPDRIFIDESSRNTAENLRHALPLIEALSLPHRPLNLMLATGGFHLVRTLALARHAFARSPSLKVFPFSAHGPNTAPDTWHRSPTGRSIIAQELEKLCEQDLLPRHP